MKIVKRKSNDAEVVPYTPVRSALEDLFSPYSLFEGMWGQLTTQGNVFADIWEDDDNFYVEMAMPGVKKSDISITASDDSVTVKGHIKNEMCRSGEIGRRAGLKIQWSLRPCEFNSRLRHQ